MVIPAKGNQKLAASTTTCSYSSLLILKRFHNKHIVQIFRNIVFYWIKKANSIAAVRFKVNNLTDKILMHVRFLALASALCVAPPRHILKEALFAVLDNQDDPTSY